METIETPKAFEPYEVKFAEPLDCTLIFPEGGEATGARILDEGGRFTLIGAGQSRVIGEIANLIPETATEIIKANIKLAARI
jgi:hypothetical protein